MTETTQGQPSQRTLEELKVEAQARADRKGYPLLGIKPEDAREALGKLKSLDRDEWAAAWSAIGDRYAAEAEALAATDLKRADATYLQAWRVYSFARWPAPNSPGKQRAYERALAMFAAHGALQDPPIETWRIPFEGTEIVTYRQMPPNKEKGSVPIILAISGADSRKEDMAERFAPFLSHGIGVVSAESPGTGQTPIKAVPTGDRMHSAVIEAIFRMPQVDTSRVLLYGGSFGGYWAAKLAVTERARLRAVVVQSPPVHEFFQGDFIRNQVLANREYLFDLGPAMMFMGENVRSIDELCTQFEKLSLVTQGLIGKSTAPMLVIHGVRDTQVPVGDIDLLLHSGDVPKEAWINPSGGHMGRLPKGWTDVAIFKHITMPWLLRKAAEPEPVF
ncbi:MAG TPA: alpha/beta hydrolase [Candidatus Dormibacteraeota bacterium]|nr:alpha/beta hydrolase [Candidatus Dormibacteraeota bacterium]